jgi:ADP-ribosylglycohydrolase
LTGTGFADFVVDLVGTSLATQESVPAAFALVTAYGDDPWQALCAAAQLGGDSDTIAAMTGAMLGAACGKSALPDKAIRQVAEVNRLALDEVAHGLLDIRWS